MGLLDRLSSRKTISDNNTNTRMGNGIVINAQNGYQTIIFNIERMGEVNHSDGTVSQLIRARITNVKSGEAFKQSAAGYLCFEIPQNSKDMIEPFLRNIIQTQDISFSTLNYTYLGRIINREGQYNPIPSNAITKYLDGENKVLKEQDDNRRINNIKKAIDEKELKQKQLLKKIEEGKRELIEKRKQSINKINNPVLMGGVDKYNIEYYHGTNMLNGEVLRIRGIKIVGKDMTGTYIYTANLTSTPNMHDVEKFLDKSGVPVVFTLPYKLNDIVNSQYDENYKDQLKRAILQVLSVGYGRNVDENGQYNNKTLNDIGGIDKNGNIIQNTTDKVSEVVVMNIRELQYQFMKQQANGEVSSR